MRRAILAILTALTLGMAPGAALAQQSITYTYDALGRVLTATYTGGPSDGLIVTYTYDAAGNRTSYNSNGKGVAGVVVVPLLGLSLIVIRP